MGPQGNVTREGPGETRTGTRRGAEDQPTSGASQYVDAGSASGRFTSPIGGLVDHDREPLPSRVDGLPELPAEALEGLLEGLVALGLGDLPADARTGLADHLRLLLAWNRSINLTAIREPAAAVREHILDSLTAVEPLRARRIEAVLDLGSGGGYPGLPIALALPARRTLLVESVAKKARFLSVAASLVTRPGPGLVEVFHGRSEVLAADPRHRGRWPAVVARAIAPLAELAELALPLVAPGGVLVAWKRSSIEAELEAAGPAIARLGGGRPVLIPTTVAGLEDHLLVLVEKGGPTPPGDLQAVARRGRRRRLPGERLPSA